MVSRKTHCRKHNKSFTLKEIENLVPNGFAEVTATMWSNFCAHVKVEDEYWEKDGLIEDVREEFTIQLSESDFDSDTESETDTDSDTFSDDEHDSVLQMEEQRLRDTLAQDQILTDILAQ